MFSGQQKSTPMFVFIARFFLSYYKVIKKFLWHKKKRAPHPFFVKCYLFKKDVPPSNVSQHIFSGRNIFQVIIERFQYVRLLKLKNFKLVLMGILE